MLELVSQEEALAHLRADTDDLPWLAVFIPAISQAVANWLKEAWRLYEPELDEDGEPIIESAGNTIPLEDSSGLVVKPSVKAAVLIELSSAYRYREGEGIDNVVPEAGGHGYVLNKASTALLAPIRKTTVR